MATTLRRWNPWSDLFNLHSQMDQLFDSAFGPMPDDGAGVSALTQLPVDIHQTDDAYTIEASVPGFRPEDVEVSIEEGVLTIRGTMRTDDTRDEKGYVRRERRMTSVFRQIALPQEVLADDIRATFTNGVLTVHIPRAPKAQPKRIPVSTESARLASAKDVTKK